MKAVFERAALHSSDPPILLLAQARPSDRQVGSKALMLARLARLALPVPPGIVLRQGFWQQYLKFYQATALWVAFVAQPDEAHAEPLRRLLDEQPVPMEQLIRLREALAQQVAQPWLARADTTLHEAPCYAVRAAFGGVDASAHSFAGIFERRLGVGPHGLDAAVRAVWRSALSAQALACYTRSGAPSALSLLIQIIPTLDSAGILSTRAPEDASALLVQAVWGLAEPLLQGHVRPDRWMLARHGGAVLRHTPGERRTALWLAPDGVVERVLEGKPPAPLSEEQLNALRRLTLRIERVLGGPQEVEWTHDGARFWIVQTRSIAMPPLLPGKRGGWGAWAYRCLRSMISRTARS